MHTRIGPELAAKVAAAWTSLIAAVADGGNIGDACKAAGISRDHVYAYRLGNPQAAKEWELAREHSADAFADRVMEVAETASADPQGARVKMDAYRWLAAKRNPRAYSDKSTVDLNVRTVDLTRIIDQANARLQAQRALGAVVQGEVVRAVLPAPAAELDALL